MVGLLLDISPTSYASDFYTGHLFGLGKCAFDGSGASAVYQWYTEYLHLPELTNPLYD